MFKSFNIGDKVYLINTIKQETKVFKQECNCKGTGGVFIKDPYGLDIFIECPCVTIDPAKYEVSDEFEIVKMNIVKRKGYTLSIANTTYFIQRKGQPNITRMTNPDFYSSRQEAQGVIDSINSGIAAGNVCTHVWLDRPNNKQWCSRCGEYKDGVIK